MTQVLLAQPHPYTAALLEALCYKLNVEPLRVDSGAAAISLLAQRTPDLLVLDQDMIDMSGLECLAQARQAGFTAVPPIILTVPFLDRAFMSQAFEAGITDITPRDNPSAIEKILAELVMKSGKSLNGSVLLVEDSPMVADFCQNILCNLGLSVQQASTVPLALAKFRNQSSTAGFDVVITDFLLEGTETGLSLIRAIRAMPGRAGQTPILAMSGLSDTARRVEILRSGANEFASKPIIPEELEVRVKNLVQMRNLMDRLEAQHQMMRDMAMHDRLTGLYNRHYLEEIVPRLIREARDGQQPLSLVVIDIDHFKAINDEHGHQMGDRVLAAIAETLQAFCWRNGFVARFGGEEFIMLQPNVNLLQTVMVADRIRGRLEKLMPQGIAVSASFGVATLHPAENFDQLFKRADDLVYQAKRAGRNQVFSEELPTSS